MCVLHSSGGTLIQPGVCSVPGFDHSSWLTGRLRWRPRAPSPAEKVVVPTLQINRSSEPISTTPRTNIKPFQACNLPRDRNPIPVAINNQPIINHLSSCAPGMPGRRHEIRSNRSNPECGYAGVAGGARGKTGAYQYRVPAASGFRRPSTGTGAPERAVPSCSLRLTEVGRRAGCGSRCPRYGSRLPVECASITSVTARSSSPYRSSRAACPAG